VVTPPPLTVLYDEDCGLCAWLAAWLERADVVVAPIGSRVGERQLRDLPHAQRYATVHVVDNAGRRHSGPAGLPPLLRGLPRLRWTAALAEAMPWLTAWAYGLVARHRRTLSRVLALEACPRPDNTHAPTIAVDAS
jgi:predicted DCC family thiol-disulfide oxidoreductase YuxK